MTNEILTGNNVNEEFKAKKTDIWKVHPSQLVVEEGFNIRIDYGDIESLALSIIENGVKMPLSGYRKGETFVVTDGFRRNRAIQRAIQLGHEINAVPFMVEPKGYNVEDRLFDMLLKNDGKNLTSFEQAELFKKLQNYGFDVKQIAKKIGKSESFVYDMIQVTNVPQIVKNEIIKGNISTSLVSDIVKRTKENKEIDHEKVKEIVKIAKENKKPEDNQKITKKDVIDILPKTPEEAKKDKALQLTGVIKAVLKDDIFKETEYTVLKEVLGKINNFLETDEISADKLKQEILFFLI